MKNLKTNLLIDAEPGMFHQGSESMSIEAAFRRGLVARAGDDDEIVVINGQRMSIAAAIGAGIIDQAAEPFISSVEGRATPAPHTREDPQPDPATAETKEQAAKLLDALAAFFATPTPENRRAAVDVILRH